MWAILLQVILLSASFNTIPEWISSHQVSSDFTFDLNHPEYSAALATARHQQKPVLLLFTGMSCANDTSTYHLIKDTPDLADYLKSRTVFLPLYVDDFHQLKKDQRYVSTGSGQYITTIGQRNIDLEVYGFGYRTQPKYLAVTWNGEVIATTDFLPTEHEIKAFVESVLATGNY